MAGGIRRREFAKLLGSAGASVCVVGLPGCRRAAGSAQARRKLDSIDERAIREFVAGMHGSVLRPTDRDYEAARRIFNTRLDRRPGLIARCADTADVKRAVDFARAENLLLAVRGGGHNDAGYSTCDAGLVIDLSRMKGLEVDAERNIVRAGPGLVVGELDAGTQEAGLALVLGGCASVGIGGFTVGGGYGDLSTVHGAGCDTLASAQVVLADGRVVTASLDENPELFWALRGGGGNFGVVTSFELRAHPLTQIVGGSLLYDPAQARSVLRAYRHFAPSAPDALHAVFSFSARQDQPAFALRVVYVGDTASAESVLRTLRSFATPKADSVAAVSYHAFHLSSSPPPDARAPARVRTGFLADLPDPVIDAIAELGAEVPPAALLHVDHLHGAISRVPLTEAAFPLRRPGFHCFAAGPWLEASARDAAEDWVRRFWDAVRPHASGAYVSMLAEDDADRVAAAYGEQYPRLAALKRKYDPENLFRLNPDLTQIAD